MRYRLVSALALGGVCAAQSFAGAPAFTMLAVRDAADVTIDEFGRTLVLALDGGAVYIYESGSYSFVGDGTGHKISADGTSVAGSVFNIDGYNEATLGPKQASPRVRAIEAGQVDLSDGRRPTSSVERLAVD